MIRNTQKTLLAILFWTMATLATGQQWSEPVQISDMEGLDNYPEFCIDNNGVIHVVWTHAASSFYDHSVVYYSKSTNDGATWSEPLNISQNEEKAIARPKIVADSENRLYVAYNYNFLEVYDQKILMQRFDGQNWTTAADTVSGNQTPCWAPRLAVGTDDKVYCFFLNGGQAYTTLYRTFQNGQWGEIIEPYPEAYSISIVPIVDNSNTIHAKGSYSNSNMEHQPIYTIFENGEWANPFIKVFKRTEGYTQMAVDQNNKPHFCWAQCSPEASNNIDTLTHFYLENDQWKSEVLEITESQIETSDLLVDQNNTLNLFYIKNNRFYHGYKDEGSWFIEQVDSAWYMPTTKANNYKVYTLFAAKVEDGIWSWDKIFFTKREAPLSVQNVEQQSTGGMQCYPNPFRNYTNIHYRLARTEKVNITIYNTMGQPVKKLINKKQPPGRHVVVWHGSGFGGNRVPPGLYLIRMQTASHVQAQWVRLKH